MPGFFVGLEGSQTFLFGQMIELLVPAFRLARLLPEFVRAADNVQVQLLAF